MESRAPCLIAGVLFLSFGLLLLHEEVLSPVLPSTSPAKSTSAPEIVKEPTEKGEAAVIADAPSTGRGRQERRADGDGPSLGFSEETARELIRTRHESEKTMDLKDYPAYAKTDYAETFDFALLGASLALQTGRPVLRKGAEDAKARFVFIAGLEGSGHHFWVNGVFHKMASASTALQLSSALFKWKDYSGIFNQETLLFGKNAKGKPCASGRDCVTWRYSAPTKEFEHTLRTKTQVVRKLFDKLLRRAKLSKAARVFQINENDKGNMLSYPSMWGRMKVFQYPDVRMLAEVAQSAGADLRIIVMHRSAASLLASTVQHRHFAPYGQEALVLAHSARVLTAQLRSLDAEFFRCIDYDALPSLPPHFAAWLLGEKGQGEELAALVERNFRKEETRAARVDDLPHRHLEAALKELVAVANCAAVV